MSAKAFRRLRTALIVLLLLATLYVAYRYTLHRMVEAKLNEIRQQGCPVTLAELDKWYPQPPPGENAADVYIQAFGRYVKDKSDTNLPIVGNARMPDRGMPLSEDTKRGIADYLARNQSALDFLYKAAAMKSCRYPPNVSDFSGSMRSLMQQFQPVRQGARLLYLETLSACEGGDTQSAVRSITASIALAESLRDRSIMISYLVEHACLEMTISCLERALSRTEFNEHQLTELGDAFYSVQTNNAFECAFIGERAWANAEWLEICSGRGHASDLLPWAPEQIGEFDRALSVVYRPTGLVDLDYLVYLQSFDDLLRTTNMSFPDRLEKAASLRNRSSLKVLPVARIRMSLMTQPTKFEARLQAHLRSIHAALSVERYRIANGALPDSLSDLVPKFLSEIPTDPFDGQPLRYKKLAKGYVVYSVGEDGKDDGGVEPTCGYGPGTDITFTVER
jgi:hypothetical protein